METQAADRSTKSAEPATDSLFVEPTDAAEIARLEARNALRQFDGAMKLVRDSLSAQEPFRLRPSHFSFLNALAVDGLKPNPGQIRNHKVHIEGSGHIPPPCTSCQGLVEEMCDYVNANWGDSALRLAAYVMWRLNWIHPFADGNGRTSRMAGYAVLNIRLGFVLPGTKTIPEQIAADKRPYYSALESADAADKAGKVDVGQMEKLLGNMLAKQLVEVFQQASGH